MSRFAAPQLLALGPPPLLATTPYEQLQEQARAKFVEGMAAIGVPYNVGRLRSDPNGKTVDVIAYRDYLRLSQIDSAIAQTYLGSATGEYLTARAADYGTLRREIMPADPVDGTPAVIEDDDSLRLRARLAWEALSVAGPEWAYVYLALKAHPDVSLAAAYGPESGHVPEGHALVVVQARSGTGVPTNAVIDAVAQELDAYEIRYGDGGSRIEPVRNGQSGRPLGARVTVTACQPLIYTTTATLYLQPDGDRDVLVAEARRRLDLYLERRRRVGTRISREGRAAVLSLADAAGLPAIDEVEVSEPDVVPTYLELPVPGTITLTTVLR